MSHTVAVGEFEGPLGALLELVERNKLEVSAISVGQITTEYLGYIRTLAQATAEDLSEFIQLGARLLYIKSLALLPQDSSLQEESELRQLEHELTEYRQFQSAAKALSSMGGGGTWTHPVTRRDTSDLPFPNLTLEQLATAFSMICARTAPVSPEVVVKQHLSLEIVTEKLRRLVPSGFNLETQIRSCRSRLEIVVTFLAILELIREGTAQVIQNGQFETILVGPANV